ncbi:MAG TPA: alpha/beta hydrolase [Acidimicrobiales bacterium]|nr:alpha/beta hydrolase [Acidimicrobiales bacterium]
MTVLARNIGVEIFYETFGSERDPTLLLVNGLGSQCISYRSELCEQLAAAGHFVVRYDNRDVGLSTKFADSDPDVSGVISALAVGRPVDAPYLLSDMAADGLAVLDALGVARAHVLGASMGGMIVQTMAIEHPDRLATMTSLMSTTGDPDVGQPTKESRRLLLAPPPVDRQGFIATQLAGARAWGSPDCYDPERLTANAAEAFDRCFDPAGTARQLVAVMASGARTTALRGVGVPTLVLHGDADKLIDPSGGRRTAEAVPGARLVLLERMGHDYPPQYWDQLVGLVSSHTGRAPV